VFKGVYCLHAFISYATRAIDMLFNKRPRTYLLNFRTYRFTSTLAVTSTNLMLNDGAKVN